MVLLSKALSAQAAETDTIDERCDTHGVEPLAGQKNKAHKIAKCIGECQDFGCHVGAAYGVALSPPFAPCPWR